MDSTLCIDFRKASDPLIRDRNTRKQLTLSIPRGTQQGVEKTLSRDLYREIFAQEIQAPWRDSLNLILLSEQLISVENDAHLFQRTIPQKKERLD